MKTTNRGKAGSRKLSGIWQAVVVSAAVVLLVSSAYGADAVSGKYFGLATITQVNSKAASLGTVDLAFYLEVNGTVIDNTKSYIILDKTLLYKAVAPQVGGVDVGPRVSGQFNPSDPHGFYLTTGNFTTQVLTKTVTRNIVLDQTTLMEGGSAISGSFTESVSSLDKDVIIIKGTFTLVKADVVVASATIKDTDGNYCIGIGELRAGGADPAVIEFSDMSYALHLYNNAGISPNLCTPKELIVTNALKEYYGTQK